MEERREDARGTERGRRGDGGQPCADESGFEPPSCTSFMCGELGKRKSMKNVLVL